MGHEYILACWLSAGEVDKCYVEMFNKYGAYLFLCLLFLFWIEWQAFDSYPLLLLAPSTAATVLYCGVGANGAAGGGGGGGGDGGGDDAIIEGIQHILP